MAEQPTGSVTKLLRAVAAVSSVFALSGLSFALVYPNASIFTVFARLVYSLGVFGTMPLLLWYSYRNSESPKRAAIRRQATSAEDDDPHSPSETAELTALAKGGLPTQYSADVELLVAFVGMGSIVTLLGVRVPLSLPVVGPVSLGWYLFLPIALVGYAVYCWFFDILADVLYRAVS